MTFQKKLDKFRGLPTPISFLKELYRRAFKSGIICLWIYFERWSKESNHLTENRGAKTFLGQFILLLLSFCSVLLQMWTSEIPCLKHKKIISKSMKGFQLLAWINASKNIINWCNLQIMSNFILDPLDLVVNQKLKHLKILLQGSIVTFLQVFF